MKSTEHDLRGLGDPPITADIIDLAVVRRGRSTDDWFVGFSVVGFCVLTGMLALKFSLLLGPNALMEWIK